MKILVACDSFKGCCNSEKVNQACIRGLRKVNPTWEVESVILSDGGDGMLQSMIHHQQTHKYEVEIHDPLMRKIIAHYAVTLNGTVIMEMAQANGIMLLKKKEFNPEITTSYGCGELIIHALDQGYRDFIVGLGGSITNESWDVDGSWGSFL